MPHTTQDAIIAHHYVDKITRILSEYDRLCPTPKTQALVRDIVVTSFLNGASHTLELLCSNDGALSAQQLSRGVKMAGEGMGYEMHSGEKPEDPK